MRPRPGGRGERGTATSNQRATHRIASMRPRPGGRGERGGRTEATRQAWNASMRPRPGGRGERRRPPRPRHAAQASMRPRPGGRGERRVVALGVEAAATSFNAATTRRPWRAIVPQGVRRQALRRFNAATTRRPWRATAVVVGRAERVVMLQCGHDPEAVESARACWRRSSACWTLQCGHDPEAVESGGSTANGVSRLRASMRPRPGGRGELSQLLALMPAAQEDFNAATTRRPWRASRRRHRARAGREASMRPRPGGRGEQACSRARSTANARPASMRPRPGGRGESPTSTTPRSPKFAASMRPRPGGRGERVLSASDAAMTRKILQCGHDPEAVESHRSPRPSTTPIRLASMRPRPGGRGEHGRRAAASYCGRFNAATTRRPWRAPAKRNDANAARPRTSMRPRPGGRGEHLRAAAEYLERRRSFNAATTRRPWRAAGCGGRPHPTAVLHFNAATTRRPWRAAVRLRTSINWAVQLQCGHDPEAVESFDLATRGVPGGTRCFNAATTRRPWRAPPASVRRRLGSQLQCGHDPEAVESLSPARRRAAGPWMLQCGHDPEAVESLRTSRPSSATERFNAATTRRPWRAAWSAKARRQMLELQCGHDPEAVESDRSCRHLGGEAVKTSMRPRPGGRGERGACWPGSRADKMTSMRPRPGGRGERRVRGRCRCWR